MRSKLAGDRSVMRGFLTFTQSASSRTKPL